MKFGTLVSIIGAVGLMSLLSTHSANAATAMTTPAQAAEQFDASVSKTSELPEPATWTMLIVGFGAIGVTLRRGRARRLQIARAAR